VTELFRLDDVVDTSLGEDHFGTPCLQEGRGEEHFHEILVAEHFRVYARHTPAVYCTLRAGVTRGSPDESSDAGAADRPACHAGSSMGVQRHEPSFDAGNRDREGGTARSPLAAAQSAVLDSPFDLGIGNGSLRSVAGS
jgi:hypothetical protein